VRLFTGAIACALLFVAGCGSDKDALAWCHGRSPSFDPIFPGNTLGDWRAHAHHIAVVRIVGIKRDKAPLGAEPWDTGLPVSTLRVERLVWSAPDAPRPPHVLPMRRVSETGTGRSYLMVLVDYGPDRNRWGPLSCSVLLLDSGGRTTDAYYSGPPGLVGKTPEQIAGLLRRSDR
jgi:hypothetical protein